MSNQEKKYVLTEIIQNMISRSLPDSCVEIGELLSNLPIWSSFINTSPKPEQKRALQLINEVSISPTTEEILFLADLYSGKYHRIRKDGEFSSRNSEKAKVLYQQYYELTNDEETKYILDHFDEFAKLCWKSIMNRQRHDDYEPYKNDSHLSTSRDPDSNEWKK